MLFSDVTPELAAVLEEGRVAERASRARVLAAAGRPASEIALVLARYDARYPSWINRTPAPVVHAPARRRSTVVAMPAMMSAAMMATGAMTF